MNIGDPVIITSGIRTDEVGIITGFTPGFHEGFLVTIGEETYPKDAFQIERLYRFLEVLDEIGITYEMVEVDDDPIETDEV